MNSTCSQLGRCCLALLFLVPAIAHAQYVFYGVGDLPGGIIQSVVRDTTRVANVLYAVGGSAANAGSPGTDTAFLWTSSGGMTALPLLAPSVVGGTNTVIAPAITPNGAYIASRARFNPANNMQRHAVRVTTSGLTNLDLGTLPGFPEQSTANAISSDGSVLYGVARYIGSPSFQTQAVRYTAAGPTITAIPFLNGGDNASAPIARGTSSNGSVMVGTSTNTAIDGTDLYGPGNAAFRYVQGSGVSAIPYLPTGGTWNMAAAVSADGNLALVIGNSTLSPNGELYLYNATTSAITALGTPAGGWYFGRLTYGAPAGMTTDGSVVVIAMRVPDGLATASFLRNTSGWHELHTIIAGTGIDLTGWRIDNVLGMSSDGTRIWGSGVHNGNEEGFIVEFPAGYLAAYAASLPAQSIVGSYTFSDTTTEGAFVITFLANGTYFEIEDALASDAPGAFDGFERGTYTWNPVTKAFTLTTLLDTNGPDGGASSLSGKPGMTVTLLNNIFTLNNPVTGEVNSLPLVTGSSPIVGTWVVGDTTIADSSLVFTFFANGTYLLAADGPSGNPNGQDGMERGTYTWNSGTGAFTATTLVDTNLSFGLSHPDGSVTVTINGNTLTATDNSGPTTATRVVAAPLAPSVAVMTAHRVHGGAGPFDLVFGTVTTNPTTEPRIGPAHNVVFTFDKPVTAGSAAVTEGVATVGAPTFNGNQMTVPLTGVTNQQYVTVTVSNIVSADGGTGGSGLARIGFLVGDVSQNRVVTVADLGLVNAQLAQPVTAANYLKDVNASGTLSVADKGITNANLTKALPAP